MSIIELMIEGRPRDIGDGFVVRRVLPYAKRRTVGPFIFFDEMGPVEMTAGHGMDVRPHPHIGLATVTYLFDGEIMHRDSLGVVQPIRPGDVNWMTAGRGIAHSERSPDGERGRTRGLHGIQAWVALPQALEEVEPSFRHHPASDLPEIARDGARLRLIAGTAYGAASPVETVAPTMYLDAVLAPGASLSLPAEHEERAVYVVEGNVTVGGEPVAPGAMAVLTPGAAATLEASTHGHAMLLGGAPLDGERFIWWNFVSSSKDRLERAKADWAGGRFPRVPGETEFIPLPQD